MKKSVNCKNCNINFEKHEHKIKATKNNFCSLSCSAKFNNKKYPKRKLEGSCFDCNIPIGSQLKYCVDCRKKYWGKDMTISQAIYHKHHRSNAYTLIRVRARSTAKKLGWTMCLNCNYDKHVQICHVKPICEFDDTTLISVVNDPSNLVPLCPNCHWELDNGLITLSVRDRIRT